MLRHLLQLPRIRSATNHIGQLAPALVEVAYLRRSAAVGNRRMASRRLPSLPFLFSCRSFFHRLHETVSTCHGMCNPECPALTHITAARCKDSRIGMHVIYD